MCKKINVHYYIVLTGNHIRHALIHVCQTASLKILPTKRHKQTAKCFSKEKETLLVCFLRYFLQLFYHHPSAITYNASNCERHLHMYCIVDQWWTSTALLKVKHFLSMDVSFFESTFPVWRYSNLVYSKYVRWIKDTTRQSICHISLLPNIYHLNVLLYVGFRNSDL